MGSHTPAVFEFGEGTTHLSQSLISIAAELLARIRLHRRGTLDMNFRMEINILNSQHLSTTCIKRFCYKSLYDWQTDNQLACCPSIQTETVLDFGCLGAFGGLSRWLSSLLLHPMKERLEVQTSEQHIRYTTAKTAIADWLLVVLKVPAQDVDNRGTVGDINVSRRL
jgi:hypothetical protein